MKWMPDCWFMYDCHLFTHVDLSNRAMAFATIRDCFKKDGCGLAYIRIAEMPLFDKWNLRAKYKNGEYVVLDEEINAWLDMIEAADWNQAKTAYEEYVQAKEVVQKADAKLKQAISILVAGPQ